MPKRSRDYNDSGLSEAKRTKISNPDRISQLSDELLLRILSNVPVSALLTSQRVSHRFRKIADDSQLWKAAYYNRFVLPRASRIPGVLNQPIDSKSLLFSSRASKWLEDGSLVQRGRNTDWRRQYKLRHNWTRGSCGMSEIEVMNRPPISPLLVHLMRGLIFTVDLDNGLRVFDLKGSQKLLAIEELSCKDTGPPTALGIDTCGADESSFLIAIGFEYGQFRVYRFRQESGHITLLYSHPSSSNGMLTALALSGSYLLTITARQQLSLYSFDDAGSIADTLPLGPPRLLCSLKSHTVWPPTCLSLRTTSTGLIASIAYAIPTYLSGWSVALQEVRIAPDGEIAESRLASVLDQKFRPLLPDELTPISSSPRSKLNKSDQILSSPSSRPSTLSYTHPYLLASHPDNTLSLYLVKSTSTSLEISNGTRLWGHTSSISGAHVASRGRAVSVSCKGGELRVWELEGGTTSAFSKRRMASGEFSVQLRPENKDKLNSDDVDLSMESMADHLTSSGSRHETRSDDTSLARGWIGFDEENVIVLKEKDEGKQALVVYDFT